MKGPLQALFPLICLLTLPEIARVDARTVWTFTVYANNTPPGALDLINQTEIMEEFLKRKPTFLRVNPGQIIPAANTTAAAGCCSFNYKTCISWCGSTEASCDACSFDDSTYNWLPTGDLATCVARWGSCRKSENMCCPGMYCYQVNRFYQECRPF
jgi:hypothetical protein